MLSHQRPPWFVWIVAAGNMFLILIIAGTTFYSGSVFLVPLQNLMGTNRTDISKVFAIIMIVNGVLMPVAGLLIDRWGPRRAMIFGMSGLAVVFFLFSRATAVWQLYLIAVLQGIFQPISGGMSNQAIVGRWFKRKRGRAMGLMGAGIGLGGLVVPWLLGVIIETFDIRTAYLFNTGCLLFLNIPIILFILRDSPHSVGLPRDGYEISSPSSQESQDNMQVQEAGEDKDDTLIFLKDAVKTLTFWAVLVSSALGLSMIGIMSLHLPAMLQDAGMSLSVSAGYLGMMLGIGIAGRISVGELTDRIKPRFVYSVAVLLMGLGSLTMLLPQVPLARIAFIAIFGITQAATSTLIPLIIQSIFGVRSFGRIYGPIGLCTSFAIAGGNYLGGYIRDLSGNYNPAIILTAVVGLLSFGASFFINPVVKEGSSHSPDAGAADPSRS
jgi:MFS family permease